VITKGPTPFDQDAAVRMDGDVVADMDAVLAALMRGCGGREAEQQPD
jgi:hypothetical protein